jgi:hypothetical protein
MKGCRLPKAPTDSICLFRFSKLIGTLNDSILGICHLALSSCRLYGVEIEMVEILISLLPYSLLQPHPKGSRSLGTLTYSMLPSNQVSAQMLRPFTSSIYARIAIFGYAILAASATCIKSKKSSDLVAVRISDSTGPICPIHQFLIEGKPFT